MRSKSTRENEVIFQFKDLDISSIVEDPDNDKIYDPDDLKNLIADIEQNGYTTPISVFDLGNGQYQIFSGHRRYRAMTQNGYERIPANVFPAPQDDIERARRLIRSNSLTRKRSPIQQAREIQYYYDNVIRKEKHAKGEHSRKRLAEEFEISEAQIAKLLALLKLIPELQELANDPDLATSAFAPAAQLPTDKQRELYEFIFYNKTEQGYQLSRKEILQKIDELKGIGNPDDQPLPSLPKESASEASSKGSAGRNMAAPSFPTINPNTGLDITFPTWDMIRDPSTDFSGSVNLDGFLDETCRLLSSLRAETITYSSKAKIRKSIQTIREALDRLEDLF